MSPIRVIFSLQDSYDLFTDKLVCLLLTLHILIRLITLLKDGYMRTHVQKKTRSKFQGV